MANKTSPADHHAAGMDYLEQAESDPGDPTAAGFAAIATAHFTAALLGVVVNVLNNRKEAGGAQPPE
jgi:hypothetical protein